MSKHAELQALKQEIMSSLHVAMPGFVESYDDTTMTAVIRPAVKSRSGAELPLLYDVPVFMPVSVSIEEGAYCLVIFADTDIDNWLSSGEVSQPASDRKHSLSDGFAFVGFLNADAPSPGGGDLPLEVVDGMLNYIYYEEVE